MKLLSGGLHRCELALAPGAIVAKSSRGTATGGNIAGKSMSYR